MIAEAKKRPVVKKEILFALAPGHIDDVVSTLQRITLFRAAARMAGNARDMGDEDLEAVFENACDEMLTSENYDGQFGRISEAYKRVDTRFASVMGTAHQGDVQRDLATMDDVLSVVAPTARTTKLSLCMGKRFIQYNTLDPKLVDEPVMKPWMKPLSGIPGTGYLRAGADRYAPSLSRSVFRSIGLDPRLIDDPAAKPAIGYIRTWTRNPEKLQALIVNAQTHIGRADISDVTINNMAPVMYFNANKSPQQMNGQVDPMDPVLDYFLRIALADKKK